MVTEWDSLGSKLDNMLKDFASSEVNEDLDKQGKGK